MMVEMANPVGPHGRVSSAFPPNLIIVTHRGPVSLTYGPEREILVGHAAGGLAPSLTSALSGTGARWLACASGEVERDLAESGVDSDIVSGIDVQYVAMSEVTIKDAYLTIANETLWFVYHGMIDFVDVEFGAEWRDAFANFRFYNQTFAKTIVESAPEGATIMVNDYHLPLVGPLLASERPDLKTVHFSHTPFCTPEQLAVLPDDVVEEILTGMSAFGACGFHTERWAEAFTECSKQFGVAVPEVFSCPLGVDAEALLASSSTPAVMGQVDLDDRRFSGRRVIFRSDRLDPTKNLVRGFDAYERLLERYPQLCDQVVFHARSYLSRTDLAAYRDYHELVVRRVREINARFGGSGIDPIVFEVDNDYDASLAAYHHYDVLLVNPIRDGMNLIAKEGPIVNTRDGALVLSTGAGAFEQLRDVAIGVDPLDVEATSEALFEALELPEEERARRARGLKAISSEYPPAVWLGETIRRACTR